MKKTFKKLLNHYTDNQCLQMEMINQVYSKTLGYPLPPVLQMSKDGSKPQEAPVASRPPHVSQHLLTPECLVLLEGLEAAQHTLCPAAVKPYEYTPLYRCAEVLRQALNQVLEAAQITDCLPLLKRYQNFLNQLQREAATLFSSVEQNYLATWLQQWSDYLVPMAELQTSHTSNEPLTKLILTRHGINARTIRYIANTVSYLSSIRELDLSRNQITGEGLAVLGEVLSRYPDLEKLILFQNPLGETGTLALAELLANPQSKLRVLDVNETQLQGIERLAHGLRHLQQLESLDLGFNNLNDQDLAPLLQALLDNSQRTLKSLHLAGNKLSNISARALLNFVNHYPNLTKLIVDGNPFDAAYHEKIKEINAKRGLSVNAPVAALRSAIPKTADTATCFWQLLPVELSGEALPERFLNFLSTSLPWQIAQRNLNLSKGAVTTKAITKLYHALIQSPQVDALNLWMNNLDDWAACILASLLAHPDCRLRSLDLNENQLTDVGIKQLAWGLARNSSLEKLDIGFNQITDSGLAELIKAAEKHPNLTTLKVAGNQLTDRSGWLLLNWVQANNKVVTITADENKELTDNLLQQISRTVNNNRNLHCVETPENVEELTAHLVETQQELNSSLQNPEQVQAALNEEDSYIAQQVTEIKQAVDSKTKAINYLQSQGATIQQIKLVEHDVALLKAEYERKLAKRQMREMLFANPKLYQYYHRVHLKLTEWWLAERVLATGRVSKEKKGLNYIGDVIEIAGDCVPLPGASAMAKVLSIGVKFAVEHYKNYQQRHAMDMMPSIVEQDKLAGEIALSLANRYQWQIEHAEPADIYLLAECAVRRLIEVVRLGETSDLPQLERLLRGIISVKLKEKTIHTTLQRVWTDAGVYGLTGIETNTGQRFEGPRTQAALYGYRQGSIDEAMAFGLKITQVQTPAVARPVRPPRTALPKVDFTNPRIQRLSLWGQNQSKVTPPSATSAKARPLPAPPAKKAVYGKQQCYGVD